MLHEYRREEIIGKKMYDLYVWVDHEERDSILNLIKEKGALYNQEVTFRKKSGELRTALYSADIINMNGIECVFGMMNDITERKKFMIEMARLERLKLIGEIAAGIGHEIRNPMTTVRGFLQILRTKPECVNYYDYYTLMIEELDRMNSIISEFLSLAQNRILEKKQNNINSIMEAILPLIQSDATNNDITVVFSPETVPDMLLDEKEIRQLILNLVRNGLEAMQPGGTLTLRTFKENGDIVFSVKDQGKGIEPKVLEEIGTPFFTTKDNGTGLGLALCYSIATRHNAKIEIDTNDRGTTFFVKFKQET
jgi:two-component system, sporulation sensor kinase E